MAPVSNIILFGETGSGKSSIVNMIAERTLANMSSGATGCTFQNAQYQIDIKGTPFNVYDTAGLNEGEAGKVPKQEAVVQLYKLICSLSDGLSLLVFCMRGPRIKDAAHKNWRLFHEIFCRKQVPIVIAITGLEQEASMDDWWYRNKGAFQEYGMNPSGHACITATQGKQKKSGAYMLSEEYEESKLKVWNLIRANYLERPWIVEKIEWFSNIVTTSYSTDWLCRTTEHSDVRREAGTVVKDLVERCEMSPEEAQALAEKLEGL